MYTYVYMCYMYLYREDPRQSSVLIAFHGNVTTTRTIRTKVKENLFRVSRCEPHLAFCFSSSFSFCLCSIKVSIPKPPSPPPKKLCTLRTIPRSSFPQSCHYPKSLCFSLYVQLETEKRKKFFMRLRLFSNSMPHAPCVSYHPPLS